MSNSGDAAGTAKGSVENGVADDAIAQAQDLSPRLFSKSPSVWTPEDRAPHSTAAPPSVQFSSKHSMGASASGFWKQLSSRKPAGLLASMERRLSWGYEPSIRRRVTGRLSVATDGDVGDNHADEEDDEFLSAASRPLLWLLTTLRRQLEETFPNHDDKETEFQESLRDGNRALTLRNLGIFSLCYLALGTLCVVTVVAADEVADGAGKTLSASQATCTAALVAAGFVTLAMCFVTLAASPNIRPASLACVKSATVSVVIGCVAVADALPWISDGDGRERPELFVATVAFLCCLPPLLEASPAATVASAPVVVLAHLAAALATAAGRASFASRGAPRVMLMAVAAWLASLHSAGLVEENCFCNFPRHFFLRFHRRPGNSADALRSLAPVTRI